MIIIIGCVSLIVVSIIAAFDIDRYSLRLNKTHLDHEEIMKSIAKEHKEVREAMKLNRR